jgi:hypothetical protein
MTRCEYRRTCLIEVVVDGIELQTPRSTLGPCRYEVTDDLMSCFSRVCERTWDSLRGTLEQRMTEKMDALILDAFLNG